MQHDNGGGEGGKLLNSPDSQMHRNDWYKPRRKDLRHDCEGHVAWERPWKSSAPTRLTDTLNRLPNRHGAHTSFLILVVCILLHVWDEGEGVF
jgi:hypothetical protein